VVSTSQCIIFGTRAPQWAVYKPSSASQDSGSGNEPTERAGNKNGNGLPLGSPTPTSYSNDEQSQR